MTTMWNSWCLCQTSPTNPIILLKYAQQPSADLPSHSKGKFEYVDTTCSCLVLWFFIPSWYFMGVSENRENPFLPNGFADHYPVFRWLFVWEYSLFSDKPIWCMLLHLAYQSSEHDINWRTWILKCSHGFWSLGSPKSEESQMIYRALPRAALLCCAPHLSVVD